jgi:uncharacterized protein YegL
MARNHQWIEEFGKELSGVNREGSLIVRAHPAERQVRHDPFTKIPSVIAFDLSGSMIGEGVREIEAAYATFRDEFQKDRLAQNMVETAVVGFRTGVEVLQDFVAPHQLQPENFHADGMTELGGAILTTLAMIEGRKQYYKANDIDWRTGMALFVTDGMPTSGPEVLEKAAKAIRAAENATNERDRVICFAVVVSNAKVEVLRELFVRQAIRLGDLDLRTLFAWFARSLRSVSASRVGDTIKLPPLPNGWTQL